MQAMSLTEGMGEDRSTPRCFLDAGWRHLEWVVASSAVIARDVTRSRWPLDSGRYLAPERKSNRAYSLFSRRGVLALEVLEAARAPL
jgi:hypothetical protein